MKTKFFTFLSIIMILSTIFIGSVSSNQNLKLITNHKTFLSNHNDDDVPIWEKNTLWTYRIDDFNLVFDETEGRSYEVHIKSDEFKLKVTSDSGSLYITEFKSEVYLEIIINMDLNIDDKDPITISLLLPKAKLEGNIYFDKSTMGILKIDANIKGKFRINSTSPINLQFLSSFPIPLDINMIIEFDKPYSLIDFPINTDKIWGLPKVNITMDGEIKSILFRIIHIVNNIAKIFGMGFIPPELAQFLPVIDISDLLTLLNVTDSFGIPEIPEIFKCSTQKSITVEAGTYDTYEISLLDNLVDMYYSPDEGVILKITGNFSDLFPFLQDVNIELIDVKVDTMEK